MELIGKKFDIFFTDDASRILHYQGEILSIQNNTYVVADRKIGKVILPIEKCRLEEIRHG